MNECKCKYVFGCMHVCVCVALCLCLAVYLCVAACLYVAVCVCGCMYVCVAVCICGCMYSSITFGFTYLKLPVASSFIYRCIYPTGGTNFGLCATATSDWALFSSCLLTFR